MRSFLLRKLVRDKVFTSMQELGQKVTYRQLDDIEFVHELKRKLLEEANEFNPTDDKASKELADLLEVIETLGNQLGTDFENLRQLQLKIREERGGFQDRIFVERLDLQDHDPWVDYYTKEPGRFKEV